MAGISLRSNIAALVAQRRLGEASDASARSFERLSSGFRINKASDDAAGLAIATSLNASRRVFTRGIQNLNDGLSLTNVADGAISQLSSVVIRIRELATQSANGTLSFRQRRSIDTEAQALADEFFRISRATEFNGLRLFDSSIQELRVQGGYGVDGSVLSNLGGALGNGMFGGLSTYVQEGAGIAAPTEGVALGDLNGDGVLDMVTAENGENTVRLGNGDGTFGTATDYSTGLATAASSSGGVRLGDLNNDGILDIVTAGTISGSIGAASARLGNGDGTFKASTLYQQTGNGIQYGSTLGDLNGDGVLDLVTAGDINSTNGSYTVRLGLGDGTFGSATSVSSNGIKYAVTLGDINGDGRLDLITAGRTSAGAGQALVHLGNGDGTFGTASALTTESERSLAVSLADLNGDGSLDLVTGGWNLGNDGYTTVRLGNGNGTFGSATQYAMQSQQVEDLKLSDINGDGALDLITVGRNDTDYTGEMTIRLGNGNGTFGASSAYSASGMEPIAMALGDLNGDGVLDVVAAGFNTTQDLADVRLGTSIYGINPLLDFDLTTRAGALQSLGILDRKLDQLNSQRGTIGAFQSRLTSAVRTLGTRADNYAAAESRIKDADISADSAQLVRSQILSQAASAVLAQANQLPAIALSLLQS